MKQTSPQLLKSALLINAGFSVLCALICLLFASSLAHIMGIAPWMLYTLGVGLLLFAADATFTATRPRINLMFAKLITGADVLWVVGSVVILIFFPGSLTFNGQLIVELVAIAVAVIATLQAVGIKQLSPSGTQTA